MAREVRPGRLPWLLAGITLLLHAIGNPHYGFFRDELYFIACGRYPDWGYVDQPPLVPLLAAGTQFWGHSLFLLRLVPAVCAAAAVYISCRCVDELRGGAFAQSLAALCVALAPVLASFGMKQSTDMPALVLWPLAALCTLRAIARSAPRWWIGAGLALGIAFNAKYSVIFFAFALVVALVAAQPRAVFNRWFAAAAVLGLAIAAPNAAWQLRHGLPMWELLRNGAAGKNVVLSPPHYVGAQLVLLNPLLSLVWLSGLGWSIARPTLRWIAYMYVVLITLMIVLHAKDYYPAAVYPLLFAAGACAIEAWTQRARWARPVALAGAVVGGLALIPMAMPVLPITTFIAYEHALRITPSSGEHTDLGVLPQDYADMIGWPQMTAAIATVYAGLPRKDRSRVAIYTANYGEAAALDFFGAAYGLPPATSHHNEYYLWGTRGYAGSDLVLISINVSAQDLRKSFGEVRLATEFAGEPLAMPLERDDPICVSRNLRAPLTQVWPFTSKLYY